jgi:hypothetical protein
MTSEKKSSFAATHPELALQADGWDPSMQTSGSNKKMSWQCDKGHTWIASIYNRSKGSGCSVCAGKQVVAGYNDLATTHPELALQADGWDPKTVVAGSNKRLRWICESGHSWVTTALSRTQGGRKNSGTGCAVCSGRKLLKGFNDLQTINPALASEALDWDPSEFLRGSHARKNWICDKKHTWTQTVKERACNGSGCPTCNGKVVEVGVNDLATLYPEIAKQANGWDPHTVFATSNKKYEWKCSEGHSWRSAVNNRTAGGNGCPICSGQSVLTGFNDLLTTHPAVASEAIGWDPSTVSAGTNGKYKWQCTAGHLWMASPHNRALNSRGCPTCATTGFDPNKPGFLYLIDHFDLEMFQIGITNFPDNRLGSHKRRGWEFIELRGPMDGHLTQQLETSCLHALEKRGAIFGNKAGIEKFDGYSEAWTKSSLNVTSIKHMLDWVYEDEEIHRG